MERITYKGFLKHILDGVDIFTHDLGQQALEYHFTKKAETLVSPYRRGSHPLSEQTAFELTDRALGALGTESHKFKLTGETDKALALAKLYEQAAARNMRKAMLVLAKGSSVLAKDLDGDPGDFVITAARHQVIAARDLSYISRGRATLSRNDTSTLIASIDQFDSVARQARVVGLFGEGGRNEIQDAIVPALKIQYDLFNEDQ